MDSNHTIISERQLRYLKDDKLNLVKSIRIVSVQLATMITGHAATVLFPYSELLRTEILEATVNLQKMKAELKKINEKLATVKAEVDEDGL